MSRETDRMLADLEDSQADRLRGEMVRVDAMREVAAMMTDIVIESVTAGVEDEDERKSVVHMIIIKLQEYRDA